MHPYFDLLRDRLLCGGVAPRHVARYLTELTEHFHDLIAEERDADRDRETSEQSALSRLGDADCLANIMIARKEFQSWSHRAPWTVFFLGPLVALVGINFVNLLLILRPVGSLGAGPAGVPMFVPSWYRPFFAAITGFDLFLLPLVVGGVISCVAIRQRSRSLWPLVGLVVVAVFCGTQYFMLEWSPVPNGVESVGVGWGFVPHSHITFDMGIRMLLNLGLTAGPLLLWRSSHSHRMIGTQQWS
jgi:hypothetical protein